MGRALIITISFLAGHPALAKDLATSTAAELPRLFVLQMAAPEGFDHELAGLIGDLVVTNLQGMNRYQVTSSGDIEAMLNLEQQKQLAGCDEQGCLVEIVGAMGASLVVGGKLSRLGERQILTMRLINAKETRLENQLTEALPDEKEELAEAIRVGTYNLMRLEVPAPTVKPWYTSPWLWAAAAVVVVGSAGVGGYFLLRPEAPPEGGLGKVTVDAR